MTDLMKLILSLSLSGSLLILVLRLARGLLQGRVSRTGQYYLWLLVIARLLLPFTPQESLMGTLFVQFDKNAEHIIQDIPSGQDTVSGRGDTALVGLPLGQGADSAGQDPVRSATEESSATVYNNNSTETGASPEYDTPASQTDAPVSSADSPENTRSSAGQMPATSADAFKSASFTAALHRFRNVLLQNMPVLLNNCCAALHRFGNALLQNLWLIWLMTALLLLVRKVTAYQSYVKYIKAGCREVSDTALLDTLAQISERFGVTKPVELYENPMAASPMLLGFLRPCIVLPCADLPEQDFRHIVLHELIHYKRHDLLYKWLVQLAVCLHWFNPLVRLMDREINRACELACDEAVLRFLPEQERHAYGDTLMHALEKGYLFPCKNCPGSLHSAAPASITLGESAKLLKERLNAILVFKPKIRWSACVSLLLAAVLTWGFTVSGAYSSLSDSKMPDSQTAPWQDNSSDNTNEKPLKEGSSLVTSGESNLKRNDKSPSEGHNIPASETPPPNSSSLTSEAGPNPSDEIPQEKNDFPDTDKNVENSTLPEQATRTSGKTYTYTYRQDGFYQAPYLFTLGWNLLERDLKHYESMELSLSDNSSITLLLDDSCRDFPQDPDACQALSALLTQLKADMADTEYPLTLPRLMNVRNTEGSTPQELAEQFYEEDLIAFSAVYPWLEAAEQKQFLDKAYNDEAVAFYACCLEHLDPDSDTLTQYAEKACKADQVSLLSVTLDQLELDSSFLSRWMRKAYAENRIAIFAVCLEHLEEDSPLILQYAQKAYEKEENTIFSVCLNHLEEGSPAILQYTRKSFEEENLLLFSVCLNYLGPDNTLMGELAETAYDNNNVTFFSCLAIYMNPDVLEYWTARAIEDKKAQFLSVLFVMSDEPADVWDDTWDDAWKW